MTDMEAHHRWVGKGWVTVEEEDLHVGGWDYLVVRVGGGVPVYLICNMHLCMHSYSCLHVGFRGRVLVSSKVTIQRKASHYMPAAISAYKEALRKIVI